MLAVLAVLAATVLSGCRASNEAAGDDASPVTLEAVTGTDRYQVTLTQEAVDRIGIRTETVRAVAAGAAGATKGVLASVPYAAVVYDSDGSTWAYTVTKKDSYVRAADHGRRDRGRHRVSDHRAAAGHPGGRGRRPRAARRRVRHQRRGVTGHPDAGGTLMRWIVVRA